MTHMIRNEQLASELDGLVGIWNSSRTNRELDRIRLREIQMGVRLARLHCPHHQTNKEKQVRLSGENLGREVRLSR